MQGSMHARLVTAVALLLMLALQCIHRYDDLRGHKCVPQRAEVANGACKQCQGAYNQTKSCFELDTANKSKQSGQGIQAMPSRTSCKLHEVRCAAIAGQLNTHAAAAEAAAAVAAEQICTGLPYQGLTVSHSQGTQKTAGCADHADGT
jgi:hypothetical protein